MCDQIFKVPVSGKEWWVVPGFVLHIFTNSLHMFLLSILALISVISLHLIKDNNQELTVYRIIYNTDVLWIGK